MQSQDKITMKEYMEKRMMCAARTGVEIGEMNKTI